MAKGPNKPGSPKSPVTVRGNALLSKDKSKVKVNFAKTAGTSQGKTPTKAKGKSSPKSKKKKKQTTDAEIQCPSQTTQSTQWCQEEQTATRACVKKEPGKGECCNPPACRNPPTCYNPPDCCIPPTCYNPPDCCSPPTCYNPPDCCKTPSMTKMQSTGSESFAAFVYSARKIGTTKKRRRSPCDWTSKTDTSTSGCRVMFDSCERQFVSDYCRKRMDRCSMSRLPGCMYAPPCPKSPVCAPVCPETVVKTPEKEELKTEIFKIKENTPPRIVDVPQIVAVVPMPEEVPPKIPVVREILSNVPEVEKSEVVVIPPKIPELEVVVRKPVPVKGIENVPIQELPKQEPPKQELPKQEPPKQEPPKKEPPAIENRVVNIVVEKEVPPEPIEEEEMEDDCPPPPCSSSCFVSGYSPPSCLPVARPQCFEACEFPFADITSRSYALSCYSSRAKWCCPYDTIPIKYCHGGDNSKVESCFYQAVDLESKPTMQRWKHERLTH